MRDGGCIRLAATVVETSPKHISMSFARGSCDRVLGLPNRALYDTSVAKTEGAVFFQNAKSIDFSNNIVYAVNCQC